MGVPASEVGYTSATTGRGDHEIHKGHVVKKNNGTNTDCVLWEVRGAVEGTSDNIQITLEHNIILNMPIVTESIKQWLGYERKFRNNNRLTVPEVLRPMCSFWFPFSILSLFIYLVSYL
jgi:hypothetical protein